MDQTIFNNRTRNGFFHCKDRAKKARQELGHNLDQFREVVAQALAINLCPYCGDIITERNFAIDHALPVCRGGSFNLYNIVIACDKCNKAKGIMDEKEFSQLITLLKSFPPLVVQDTLARLRAAGKVRRGA